MLDQLAQIGRLASGLKSAPDLRCGPRCRAARDLVAGLVRNGLEMGVDARWRSRTYGQRGWKKHPEGRLIRLGGRPEIGTSSSSRDGRAAGSISAAPTYRGAAARRRSLGRRVLDDAPGVHDAIRR